MIYMVGWKIGFGVGTNEVGPSFRQFGISKTTTKQCGVAHPDAYFRVSFSATVGELGKGIRDCSKDNLL